jgi:glycosyltransferase involved in cell wall biosynthesis
MARNAKARRRMDPMRIAQVAPIAESVPPKLYGGTERVVSWLTEELVRLGHDVTLFASGDSITAGRLISVWPRALRLTRPHADPVAAQTILLDQVAERAAEFDVIHCHIDWLHFPLLCRQRVPWFTTLHGRLDLPGLPALVERFPDARFVSISGHQRLPLSGASWLGTVHHGLPPDLFGPSFAPGSYLAFLGRLSPEKGPDVAIRLAQESNLPLHIAAKIPRAGTRYFKDHIEPMADGVRVRLVGELDDRRKEQFLSEATALLFPINWPEPFGLVMIEAMACGTPVVAFRQGSVPEIVEDGVNGFVVDSEADAIDAIKRIPELDRRRVRESFDLRFTAQRMTRDYVALYEKLCTAKVP